MKKFILPLFLLALLSGCVTAAGVGTVALTAVNYAHTSASIYIKFKEVQAQNIEASSLKKSVAYAGLYCDHPGQRETLKELADKYIDLETRRLISSAINRLCPNVNL